MFELLSSGKVRGVTVERPRIDLRYDEKNGWNHSLKMGGGSGEGVKIGRFEVQDGALSIAWPAGGSIKLAGVNGSYTDNGPGPNPFTLRGALESQELFAIDGQSGPGAAFNGRVYGSTILERDVPGIAGFDPRRAGIGAVRLRGPARSASSRRSTASADFVEWKIQSQSFCLRDPGNGAAHFDDRQR